MLQRRSFVEEMSGRFVTETLRSLKGKRPDETEQILRAKIDENIAEIEIRNTTIKRLKETYPIITNHNKKKRGYIILDYDSTIVNNQATKFQIKVIKECLSVDEEALNLHFKRLADARAELSDFILHTERLAQNIDFSKLYKVRQALQDMNSFIFNGKDKERVAQAIEEYNLELVKNLNKYFDPRITNLPAELANIGIEVFVASQNQDSFISPTLSALGFKRRLGNHIPSSPGTKIRYPDSSIPIKIISAADKHGAIKRMRRNISHIFDRDEIYKADFFSDIEAEQFSSRFNRQYEMPFFGSRFSYLVESSEEFAGDVLHSLLGMFKTEDFEKTFLFEGAGKEFSESSERGRMTADLFRKERIDIVKVTGPREISNYIANTTIYHEQGIGTRGLRKHIEILRKNRLSANLPITDRTLVDADKLDGVIEEEKRIFEKFAYIAEEYERQTGIKLNQDNIFGERKREVPYIIEGISPEISCDEILYRFLERVSPKMRPELELQREFMGDIDGTLELVELFDQLFQSRSASEKNALFRDMDGVYEH